MELGPSTPHLLPEIIDKIIGHGQLEDILTWSKVSRATEKTALSRIEDVLLRPSKNTLAQIDISKVHNIYENLTESEQRFVEDALKIWNPKIFTPRKKPLRIKKGIIEIKTPKYWDNAAVNFFGLANMNLLSSLPVLIKKNQKVWNESFIDGIMTLIVTFPMYDDITVRILHENGQLNNVEICHKISLIRGKSGLLNACVAYLEEHDQWQFLNIPAKDIDSGQALEIIHSCDFNNDWERVFQLFQFIENLFVNSDDINLIVSMFKLIPELWSRGTMTTFLEASNLRKFDFSSEKGKKIMDIALDGIEKFMGEADISFDLFESFFAYFRGNLDDKNMRPVHQSILRKFNGHISADDIIKGFICSHDWKSFENLPTLIELGFDKFTDDLVNSLAKLRIFDDIVLGIVNNHKHLISEATCENIAPLKSEGNPANWEPLSELLNEAINNNGCNQIPFILKNLIAKNADESFIVKFLEENFILTTPTANAASDSDSIQNTLLGFVLSEDMSRVERFFLDKIEGRLAEIEEAGRKGFIWNDFVNSMYPLFVDYLMELFGIKKKSSIEKMAKLFCNMVPLEDILNSKTLPFSSAKAICEYAALSRRYETSELQPLIEKILSAENISNIFSNFCSLYVPVEKMTFVFDRIYESRAVFYSSFKMAVSKKVDSVYIHEIAKRAEFSTHLNFLCSNKPGFRCLIQMISEHEISADIQSQVLSTLINFKHSEWKIKEFLSASTVEKFSDLPLSGLFEEEYPYTTDLIAEILNRT